MQGTGRRLRRQAGREAGAATVWVLIAVIGLCALAGFGGCLAAVAAAVQRARTGADLSALAAASALVRHEGAPCDRAARVARANEVTLRRCLVDGRTMRVWVAARLPRMLRAAGFGPATARARAGPVTAAAAATGPAADSRGLWEPVGSRAPPVAVGGWQRPAGQRSTSLASTALSSRMAPPLSSGSLPLPHFGECTHDGQPSLQPQAAMASRVAVSQESAFA